MASVTQHPNHQLISSEDVEGTEVYDPQQGERANVRQNTAPKGLRNVL
jgi:hypothetical protein